MQARRAHKPCSWFLHWVLPRTGNVVARVVRNRSRHVGGQGRVLRLAGTGTAGSASGAEAAASAVVGGEAAGAHTEVRIGEPVPGNIEAVQ